MIGQLREQIKQRDWYVRLPRAGGGSSCRWRRPGRAVWRWSHLAVVGAGVVGTGSSAASGRHRAARSRSWSRPCCVIVGFGAVARQTRQGQAEPGGPGGDRPAGRLPDLPGDGRGGSAEFEEGEDIFSKYLPWAIAFELADRWQRVCAQLVAAGRIPPTPTGTPVLRTTAQDSRPAASARPWPTPSTRRPRQPAAAEVAAAPPASAAAHSGGGGGGGGGGSW